MAKKRSTTPGSAPTYHATVGYKLWVRSELARREWGYEDLFAEMRRKTPGMTETSESLHLFLGAKKRDPVASNSALMPYINRALGLDPPPLCDPSNPLARLRDRFMARYQELTPRERAVIDALMLGPDGL